MAQPIERFRTSTMVSLSAMVVLGYDVILTIPDELEYIWFSKWSVGKLLYIAGRYPVLAFFLLNEIYEVKYWGTKFTSVMYISRIWILWICSIPLQVTLSLRTLAIWERDRRAAIVLGIGAAAYNISILVSYTFLTVGIPYMPNVSEKLAEAMLTKLGFASLMLYDGLMFILILIRTFHEGRKTRARILTILFRDGMIYYAVIFALSAANLLEATSPHQFKVSLIGSLAPALLAAQSIGASHIILNLRKYAYRSQMLTSVQLTSIRYSEGRTILDEFMFSSQPTVLYDIELTVIERDHQ